MNQDRYSTSMRVNIAHMNAIQLTTPKCQTNQTREARQCGTT